MLALVSVPIFPTNAARADPNYIARHVVQGVIVNIIRAIHDNLQQRGTTRSESRTSFTDEDSTAAGTYDDAFAALGYNGMPTKAVPQPQPAQSSFQYGATVTGTGERDQNTDETGSTTVTNSFTATGSADATKIGIFNASDTLTLLILGSRSWAQAPGTDSTTNGVAGTVSYANGGFSADFTIQSQSTKSTITIGNVNAAADSNSVSYSENVQYKFDLPHAWFIEPTVGMTYTHTQVVASQGGHSTEIQGGARIGTEVIWNGVHIQGTVTATAFSPVSDSPVTLQTGHLGGRGVAKWNLLWSDNFSSFIEVHGTLISHSSIYGTTGGLRWSF